MCDERKQRLQDLFRFLPRLLCISSVSLWTIYRKYPPRSPRRYRKEIKRSNAFFNALSSIPDIKHEDQEFDEK
jgi:hypothetical protein